MIYKLIWKADSWSLTIPAYIFIKAAAGDWYGRLFFGWQCSENRCITDRVQKAWRLETGQRRWWDNNSAGDRRSQALYNYASDPKSVDCVDILQSGADFNRGALIYTRTEQPSPEISDRYIYRLMRSSFDNRYIFSWQGSPCGLSYPSTSPESWWGGNLIMKEKSERKGICEGLSMLFRSRLKNLNEMTSCQK